MLDLKGPPEIFEARYTREIFIGTTAATYPFRQYVDNDRPDGPDGTHKFWKRPPSRK